VGDFGIRKLDRVPELLISNAVTLAVQMSRYGKIEMKAVDGESAGHT
jgi:hypothetical protein